MKFTPETIAKWKANKQAIAVADKVLKEAGLPTYSEMNQAITHQREALFDQDAFQNAVISTSSQEVNRINNTVCVSCP